MSNRLHAPALAALLAAAAIVPAPVFARNTATRHHAQGYPYYGHLYQPQMHDAKTPLPPGARGLSTVPTTATSSGVRRFETDPDSHVRFEMNRDDRDRRASGS